MELQKIADNASSDIDIHEEDSTIYLFGSELYCGWCLESFTCPVRLKIHCHIEHLATCSCGEQFHDKDSLCKHIASARCPLPPPFQWYHFVTLPCDKLNEVCITESPEHEKKCQSLDENQTADEQRSNKPHEQTSNKPVKVLDESIQKTDAIENRKTLPRTPKQKSNKELQTLKDVKFCCGLCSFQSTNRTACKRHIGQKHRKSKASKEGKDQITIDSATVTGTESKSSAIHEATTEKKLAEKSNHVSPSLASSESCCEKHRSDDIRFIVSSFSSPVGGKPLCCDLCSGKFVGLEEAAIHIYNEHLSALQQWRDTHDSYTQLLKDESYDEKPTDNAAGDQLEKLSSAVECDVPKFDNTVHDGKQQMDVVEHSSVNLEHNTSDTCVDQSKIHQSESGTKHKFTTDECKVLASSLCRLLKCCNDEPETEIHDDKTVGTHNAKVEDAVTQPSPTKKLPYSDPKKTAARCKFCHRVCSNQYNCQRHEAVCRRESRVRHQTTDSNVGVRKIHGNNIFFCAQCGFSDPDQCAVNAHMMEPHVLVNNRLHVQAQPGHDYVGSMRITPGNFQCGVCGSHWNARSKLLKHLQTHSSPAQQLAKIHATKMESPSVKVEGNQAQSGVFASASCTRTCPKCSRSFSSIAMYLCHRAVCRAVQQRPGIQHHSGIQRRPGIERRRTSKGHCYLIKFCEQTSGGRWKCTLCKHCSAHRGDLYKHIRAKHSTEHDIKLEIAKELSKKTAHVRVKQSKVQNTKLKATKELNQKTADGQGQKMHDTKLEAIKELSQKTTDGRWLCKVCLCYCSYSQSIIKHIRVQHADKLNEIPQTLKQHRITNFCVKTSDGHFQCTVCKCSWNFRSNVYRHIRSAHSEVLLAENNESNAALAESSSSIRKHTVKNTSVCRSQLKFGAKRFVKPCPNCRRTFMFSSGYKNHVKSCGKEALGRFTERVSSGRVKCRVCKLTYSSHKNCIVHLRKKHLSSGELRDIPNSHAETYVKTENPTPANDAVPAIDADKECSYDGIIEETVNEMEN